MARSNFRLLGRNVKEWNGKRWKRSNQDLDFLYEKDSLLYGVEVKNSLSYMDDVEMKIKTELSRLLGAAPVFVVRMAPRSWIEELRKQRGFTLVLKWHLYPLSHLKFARTVRHELGLPADAPRVLLDSTMARLLKWHRKRQRARQ